MMTASEPQTKLNRLGQASALIAFGLSAWAIWCWVAGVGDLLARGATGIPTAPASAVCLTMLSLGSFLRCLNSPVPPVLRRIGRVTIALIGIVGFLVVLRVWLGWRAPVAEWLARHSEGIGQVPGAPMSPWTGALLVITSAAYFLQSFALSPSPARLRVSAILSAIVLFISAANAADRFVGKPWLNSVLVFPMPLWTSLIFIFVSASFLFRAIGAEASELSDSNGLHPVLLTLALLAAIGTITAIYFRHEQLQGRQEVRQLLDAVGKLKSDQITSWRQERLDDVRLFQQTEFISSNLASFLEQPRSTNAAEPLRRWLEALRGENRYSVVAVFDTNAVMRIAISTQTNLPFTIAPDVMAEVLRTKQPVFSDLHRGEDAKEIHMDLAFPVLRAAAGSRKSAPVSYNPIGVVLLRLDPYQFLYPFLQSWPAPSHSAETVLFRREGNEILFLNELRHRTNSAMKLRFPVVAGTSQLASKAIQGQLGQIAGLDYRGVPVLGDVRKVPGFPWLLMAKVDRAEIYAPLRLEAWMMLAFTTVLAMAVALVVGFFTKQSEARAALKSLEAERAERVLSQRVEQALRQRLELQNQLSKVAATVPGAICSFRLRPDGSWSIPYASAAFEGIFATPPESVREDAGPAVANIHPDDVSLVRETIARSARTMTPWLVEFRTILKSNHERWVESNSVPQPEPDGSILWQGFLQDITDRKKLEDQFRQSQKLEGIGQLAGGVAHDFNNILAATMMQADVCNMAPDLSDELRDGLRQIKLSAERGANLTRQMLLFSRKQVMQPRELDLNEVVTSLAKMLQRIIGEDIRLQLNLNPRPVVTRADAGMLDQVLMNLVVNARDAMPNGGPISIATGERVFKEEESLQIVDAKPGRYAHLRVSDSGCGIPPENMSRIFEPFFTTKEPGKGTGLGLATVFGIVKQHGGHIQVESEVGKGTTFHIYLIASDLADDQSAAEAQKAKPRGGTETILIVEDEPNLRALTRIMFERNGYKVLEAAHGVEALRVWESHSDPIHLLLTDIVLPEGISGRELAARLLKQSPQLRVVFTSGYSADIAGRELTLQPGQVFIQKPCSPQQILETVRKCLDG